MTLEDKNYASLFNQKAPEADPISDPKPEVADVVLLHKMVKYKLTQQ